MPQINVYEAKTQLSKLLDAVERGDPITIARNGRPIADLVPHTHAVPIRFGGLVASIMEMTIKQMIGKLQVPDRLIELLPEQGLEVAAIEPARGVNRSSRPLSRTQIRSRVRSMS